jgi:hypothetical protein
MPMKLPAPRGPLSEALFEYLTGLRPRPGRATVTADPLADDDLQLALFVAHELHYGGVEGVDDELEWCPTLLAFTTRIEQAMLEQLYAEVGEPQPHAVGDVPEAIFDLVGEDPDSGLSRYLALSADLDQFREFLCHRSAYQLKEADPHTFGIPRIRDQAKAAMVEIQADEYGGGEFARMHAQLFARTMECLDLDARFGTYVPVLPGTTLATVNLISVFGLRRRWRGALTGHLAAFEISSPQPNRRYANGLRRLGLGPSATEFFDEHVEADSVHENIAAFDLAGGLARQEPDLAGQILFGARCLLHCERQFAERLVGSWKRGESSLLERRLAAAA